VAAFSARGVIEAGVVEAAKEDYRALLVKHGLPEGEGARCLVAPSDFREHP
jgi:hypothetical protein